MTITQEKITLIIFWSFFVGMFLGLIYDFFRIRRIAFKKSGLTSKLRRLFSSMVVFFEDIFFALICAVIVCIFLFYINSGRARGISLFVMVLGFYVYYNTLGRVVILCSEYIIRFIKYVFIKIYSIFLRPLLIILKILCKITLYRLFLHILTLEIKTKDLKKAEKGFNIIIPEKQGKKKNEKSYKYIYESCGDRVHSILHSYDSKDAV